jgi:hypothetical protein
VDAPLSEVGRSLDRQQSQLRDSGSCTDVVACPVREFVDMIAGEPEQPLNAGSHTEGRREVLADMLE